MPLSVATMPPGYEAIFNFGDGNYITEPILFATFQNFVSFNDAGDVDWLKSNGSYQLISELWSFSPTNGLELLPFDDKAFFGFKMPNETIKEALARNNSKHLGTEKYDQNYPSNG